MKNKDAYKLISLIGVDGAGKTTTALKLKDYIESNKRTCKVIYMGRGKNRALPGARAVARKAGINLPQPEQLPQLKGVKKRILCFLRDITYVLDAYTRYLFYIVPSLIKGEVVITDRYAYDILLNEGYYGLTKFLLLRLYPKPDYLFYLYHDPEVLILRKDEKTFKELNRHIRILRSLKEQFSILNYQKVYEVKTESLDSTLRQIVDVIEGKN